MIWLAFATMTAAVALGLVWPLARRGSGVETRQADIDFYASQLTEMQADVGRGGLSEAEAEATRAEIGRRLIASARQAETGPRRLSRVARIVAVVIAVVAVPAGSLALYLRLGHPQEPDLPLTARNDPATLDLAAALPRIEAHLAAHPEDGRGFALIAPVYMRIGRFDDAAKAFEGALRTLGESADRRAQLGQALVLAADGVVTSEARAAFDKALADDPKNPEARYFQAVAAEQDGDKARALALWQALQADSPADTPWRATVDQHIAGLAGGAPLAPAPATRPSPPETPAGAAIAALPAGQQLQMIHGMVDGLAARLAQNGRDGEGWLRLIRAYTVLGEQDKARAALSDARKGLLGDAPSLARVDALAKELGLET